MTVGATISAGEPQHSHPISEPHSDAFEVDNHIYVALGAAEAFRPQHVLDSCLTTVIGVKFVSDLSAIELLQMLQSFEQNDDVFTKSFLQGVVFLPLEPRRSTVVVASDARELLRSFGNEWIEVIQPSIKEPVPLPGVYVSRRGLMYEVLRLHNDYQDCFLSTYVTERSSKNHWPLRITSGIPQVNVVAVPSRLRDRDREPNGLQGLRIAVKDNFQIQGIHTSLCNWSYLKTYDPADSTAKTIADLESQGAWVVGSTRLASFAATEEPLECIDFQAPWNPRADGHQSPAGSSSGSGAAVASYSWLDVAIGSDTSGSGRRPAHWNGCFGMRPTHGLINKEGFIPSFPQFDTPTMFARDIDTCLRFVHAWYGSKLAQQMSTPLEIVVIEDYLDKIYNHDQLKLFRDFVYDMQEALRLKESRVQMEQTWDRNPPTAADKAPFAKYMETPCRDSFFYEDHHNFKQFRLDHERKFSKPPYISPPVRWQWNISAEITASQHDEAIKRLSVFRDWFVQMYIPHGSTSLIVIPIENMSARYRDEATTAFNPVGVPNLFLSPILGCPEVTVPIGTVPFQSKVTGKTEQLPVAVSILAPPFSDMGLLNDVKLCLQQSGRPMGVQTGSQMFDGC